MSLRTVPAQNMHHPFMQHLSNQLREIGVTTLRYNFPYMDAGAKRPDPPAVLEASVCRAIEKAKEMAGELPIIAGGKSMGGRITSQALAQKPDPGASAVARSPRQSISWP